MRKLLKTVKIFALFVFFLMLFFMFIICMLFFFARGYESSSTNIAFSNSFAYQCHLLTSDREYIKSYNPQGIPIHGSVRGSLFFDHLHYLYENTVGDFYSKNTQMCNAQYASTTKAIQQSVIFWGVKDGTAKKRLEVCKIAHKKLLESLNHWDTDMFRLTQIYLEVLRIYQTHGSENKIQMSKLQAAWLTGSTQLKRPSMISAEASMRGLNLPNVAELNEDKFIKHHDGSP